MGTHKIVTTTVTKGQLDLAEGAPPDQDPGGPFLTVKCPDYYDEAAITAADIVHDPAITVVTVDGTPIRWAEARTDSTWLGVRWVDTGVTDWTDCRAALGDLDGLDVDEDRYVELITEPTGRPCDLCWRRGLDSDDDGEPCALIAAEPRKD